MTFVDYKRQCPECLVWYGRRFYASGQKEPPCNFQRRTTCGDPECIKAQRRKKLAENKEKKVKAIEAVDIFIYGKKAIQNYIELWKAA